MHRYCSEERTRKVMSMRWEERLDKRNNAIQEVCVCVCVGVGWGAWVVLIWKQIECLNLVPVMRSGRKVEKNGLKVAGKVFEAA